MEFRNVLIVIKQFTRIDGAIVFLDADNIVPLYYTNIIKGVNKILINQTIHQVFVQCSHTNSRSGESLKLKLKLWFSDSLFEIYVISFQESEEFLVVHLMCSSRTSRQTVGRPESLQQRLTKANSVLISSMSRAMSRYRQNSETSKIRG